jgi:predicted nucleotidyltransferase
MDIAPAADAFRKLLLTKTPSEIVEAEFLNGEVRGFAPNSEETLARLRRQLASKLQIPDASIFVVGSAKTGFSLAPDEFPRAFRPDSDVDVVVVDPKRFDKIWLALIHASYYDRWAKKIELTKDRDKLADLREHISFGYVYPELCAFRDTVFLRGDKTLANENRTWFDAFQSLSLLREFAGRTVNARLYRTKSHVIAYHAQGLEALRARIGVAR